MKKYCIFLIALLLIGVVCSVGFASFAEATTEETVTIHGVVHSITDGTNPKDGDVRVVNNMAFQYYKKTNRDPAHYAVVDYFYDDTLIDTATEVVVPAEIDGIPVLSLQVYDFDRSTGSIPVKWKAEHVEKVVLPEGLINIASYAFVMFPNLESFSYPSTVKSTGYGAFENCKKLKSVSFGEGNPAISDRTFYGCSSLQTVRLPGNTIRVGEWAFAKTGLKKISVPAACNFVGNGAFASCKKLTKAVFSDGGTQKILLGKKSFRGDKRLQAVRLPGDREVALLGDVFSNCASLQKVTNTKSVTNYDNSFQNSGVGSLTIGKTVYRIDKDAFDGCTSLKKLRVLYANPKALKEHKPLQLWYKGAFLKNLPDDCKIYVKTEKMRQAFIDAGCTNRVIVKADLK